MRAGARRTLALGLGLLCGATAQAQGAVEVRVDGRWQPLWQAATAPGQWVGVAPVVGQALAWEDAGAGVERGRLDLRTVGRARHVRVHLVRVDPALVRLSLHTNVGDEGLLPWHVEAAPDGAVLAVNGGQFVDDRPWGWVVHRGRELQAPGAGSLAMALVVDSAGGVHLLDPGEIGGWRGQVREALQSYPMLLEAGGRVPAAVRGLAPGLDTGHRDTRLAVGLQVDGKVLFALTRVVVLGQELGPTPLGLTVGETAALMGAIGADRAMMLDGGLSSQLLARARGGEAEIFRGLRRVPLGIVGLSSPGDLPRSSRP